MLSLWARVDLGVKAVKGYSAFPKAPALLEPHNQIFSIIYRAHIWGLSMDDNIYIYIYIYIYIQKSYALAQKINQKRTEPKIYSDFSSRCHLSLKLSYEYSVKTLSPQGPKYWAHYALNILIFILIKTNFWSTVFLSNLDCLSFQIVDQSLQNMSRIKYIYNYLIPSNLQSGTLTFKFTCLLLKPFGCF